MYKNINYWWVIFIYRRVKQPISYEIRKYEKQIVGHTALFWYQKVRRER